MNSPSLSYEQVAAAAAHMLADGVQPNVQGIQAKLKLADAQAIEAHIQTWRQAHRSTPSDAAIAPASRALHAATVSAQAAGQTDTSLPLATQSQISALTSERDALRQQVQQLTQIVDSAQRHITHLSAHSDALTERVEQLRMDADVTQSELASARALGHVHQQQHKAHLLEQAQLHQALSDAHMARAQAEKTSAISADKIDEAAARVIRMRTEAIRLEAHLKRTEAHLEQARTELQQRHECHALCKAQEVSQRPPGDRPNGAASSDPHTAQTPHDPQ